MTDDIENKCDAVLDMSDPDFAEQLVEALGLKPGDSVKIMTPQFDRTDHIRPVEYVEDFESLRRMSPETLRAAGCGQWDKGNDDGVLMLFPAEWYEIIPNGTQVETICGESIQFKHGETDDDRRFGMLSYGVRVKTA